MSAQSLLGVGALNALFVLSGLSLLWGLRGFATWGEVARLGGLAYVLGIVTVGSAWTLLLIVGVPFSTFLVLAVPVAAILAGAVAARRRGGGRPTWQGLPSGSSAVVGAVGIAATILLLEAFFRVARLSGLYWWDAWSFWVPKAKAIYYFGALDAEFFGSLPGPSYPPFVPVLDAAVFQILGGVDVVALHLQYWFLVVGFVWGFAGLLAERVPGWMLWPFVLLLLVAPRIGRRFLVTEADLLLDYLFVLAAVLLFFWMLDHEPWRLVAATVLMSGMVLVKREGMLLAALLVVATLLASMREWRVVWRKIAAATVIVAVVAAPWRVWYVVQDIEGETPAGGGIDPTQNTERLWPSLRLAFDVLFSSDYWSVLVPVAMGALALALFARAFRPAVFFGALIALVTLGGGWITWAIPELPITQEAGGNPIVRYMGAAALLCAAASPLLLAAVWRAVTKEESTR